MLIKDLLKYWIEENTNDKLVDIPQDLYKKINEYLLRLKVTNIHDTSVTRSIKQREEVFIRSMAIDLLLLRLIKILSSMRSEKKIDVGKLPSEEQRIFKLIENEINEFLKANIKLRERQLAKEEKEMVLIKFLKPYPEIKISEKNTLGPFHKDDIVFIPKRHTEKLIKKNIVKVIYPQK